MDILNRLGEEWKMSQGVKLWRRERGGGREKGERK